MIPQGDEPQVRDELIPGADPGSCSRCGAWLKAGLVHECGEHDEPQARPPHTDALIEQVDIELAKADAGKGPEPWGVRALRDALAREREVRKTALLTLLGWIKEHLDALPAEDEEWDDDVYPVLSSLRHIVTGELACTEEADYTPGKWRCLVEINEALTSLPQEQRG